MAWHFIFLLPSVTQLPVFGFILTPWKFNTTAWWFVHLWFLDWGLMLWTGLISNFTATLASKHRVVLAVTQCYAWVVSVWSAKTTHHRLWPIWTDAAGSGLFLMSSCRKQSSRPLVLHQTAQALTSSNALSTTIAGKLGVWECFKLPNAFGMVQIGMPRADRHTHACRCMSTMSVWHEVTFPLLSLYE